MHHIPPSRETANHRELLPTSQDHRGTPEAPGRVVTLIEQSFWSTLRDPHPAPADGKVWGVAYRIESSRVAEVKEYLDIREINGYSIHYAPFHPSSSSSAGQSASPIRTLVYIGTPDNDQFTGPQDVQALAEHISRSEGPSGLNSAYLLGLDDALRELGPESRDEHVGDLSDRVRAILASRRDQNEESASSKHDFKQVSSVDEQEETEKAS